LTGGGSEADNMAIKGAAIARRPARDHLVTSAVEHPAVLQSCRFLEKMGFRVTYLEVDEDGLVRPEALRAAISEKTALVTLMMANNEVGSIHPIAELAHIAHEKDAWFHTDAIQAVGKIEVDTRELDVDMLSISAHKFHGPKGVGALYVKKDIEIEPLIHGGGQEGGLRGGTENVASIVGMGKAAELAQLSLTRAPKIRALRDRLEAGIRTLVPGALLNGHMEARLPNTLNLTLPGLRGESLVVALDRHGVSLSSGSACKSGSPEPTHVLLGMGREAEQAHCAVRLSLSRDTTKKDVDATIQALARVLDEMETTVRFIPCK
jgi:cysteine sulfinate desulfinase/cysteine desulfurase-like protein